MLHQVFKQQAIKSEGNRENKIFPRFSRDSSRVVSRT
jgi:hypothetical protein